MKEICEVLICEKDGKKIGYITGLGNALSFDPLTILSDIYETNGDIELWNYHHTAKYNLLNLIHFHKEEKHQYYALTDGIKYLIEKSYSTASSISFSDLELLRPFYEITLKFNPIAKVNTPLDDNQISYPPIYYDSFSIDTLLSEGEYLYYDYFYQCFNPADILFAIIHFLSINRIKFNKCNHCGKFFATNNLKVKYCKNKSGYSGYEKYECGEAVKRIRQQIKRQCRSIAQNLRTNYYGEILDDFYMQRNSLLDELMIHSNYQTIDKCFEYFDKKKWYTKKSIRIVGEKP